MVKARLLQKYSCTEIMQNSKLYILDTENGFSSTTCIHYWENKCADNWHGMFLSLKNKYDFNCTHYYSKTCQAISK